MKGVILAAGRGSRLDQLGLKISKPALPLLGKAMLTRVYESIVDHVENVVIVINPEDKQTLQLLTNGTSFKTHIEIVEQVKPLGSADALLKAWPNIDGPCLVSACDNLVESDFIAAFIKQFTQSNADASIALQWIDRIANLPSSTVKLGDHDRVTNIIEKPGAGGVLSEWTALPLYAFQSNIYQDLVAIELSERDEYEIPTVIQKIIDRGGVVTGNSVSERITINTPQEYLNAIRRMLNDSQMVNMNESVKLPAAVEVRPPVFVEDRATVGSEAIIGPFTYLMAGSEVGEAAEVCDSILFKGAAVAAGEYVRYKIVLPETTIDLQKSRDNHGPIHRR
jgi:glucose-1-phosphate thymidylyltransferase